jgi:DNA-binding transcriptional ArsR family regulator
VDTRAQSTNRRSGQPADNGSSVVVNGNGVGIGDGRRNSARRNGALPGRSRRPDLTPSFPEVLESAAQRLRVVGHPMRLRLLEALAAGPQSVSGLARLIGAEHQSISKHLSELLRVNAVVRRQDGNFAFYSLPDALTLRAVGLVCRSVTEDRLRLADLAAELDDRNSDPGP